jgi:(R,R)-butanediol dehydrogenase/meso-butanediol dehydrogenase/diacetyl reductase
MRQAVLKDVCKFVIEEMPKPELVPETLMLKVRYTSICGSDIHIWQWGPEPKDEKAKRAFDSWSEVYFGFPPTAILGHQLSGEVTETGPGVEPYKPGDRVTIRGAGGYADYAVAMGLGGHPLSSVVYTLPEEVSYEQAALVEPLSVAVDAVRRSGLSLGDVAVVQGAGTIGLFVMQCAKAAGARRVIVTEVSGPRIEKAKELGADEVIHARNEDVVERIRELTGGFGPDIVYDCAGSPDATRTMLEFAPTGGGKAIIVSTYGVPVELDLNMVMMKNLDVVGFLSGLPGSYPLQSDPFDIAIELIRSGRVKADSLVSAVMPLEKINEAFTKLSKAEEMVILIQP